MLFKTFKAKILLALDIHDTPVDAAKTDFIFTKSKIIFPKEIKDRQIFLSIFLACPFVNEANYTLDKASNRNDELQFRITIAGNNRCDSFIQMNIWNTFKCNIIHNRYLLYKEREWFWKTLISAFIGFVFGIIGSSIGYRQGYQAGLKQGQATHQDTTRQR